MLRVFLTILAFLVAITAHGTANAAKRFALVIGNSAYKEVPRLGNPSNDAALIAKQLRDSGFDVTEGRDLDLDGMNDAVKRYARKLAAAGQDAAGVVYYAGHGIQIHDANYLVPVDANLKTAVDVKLLSMSLNWMLEVLATAENALNIIILDACRDNPFKVSLGTRGNARGLARVDASPGMLIAYATAPGQTAADGTGSNSPYARAISEVLPQRGLTVEEVFKRVRVKVHEKTGGRQTPWETTSLVTDFYFNPKREALSAGNNTHLPSEQPDTNVPASKGKGDAKFAYYRALEKNTMDAYEEFLREYPEADKADDVREIVRSMSDENFWRRVSREDTVPAYERYMRAFPKGNFTDEAKSRIAKLNQKEQPVAQWTPPPKTTFTPPPQPTRTLVDLIASGGRWAISSRRNCSNPRKTYSMEKDNDRIVWRDGMGNVDIEQVLSASDYEFTSTTSKSIHITKKNVDTGTRWVYRKINGSRILVIPGGKPKFYIQRCS